VDEGEEGLLDGVEEAEDLFIFIRQVGGSLATLVRGKDKAGRQANTLRCAPRRAAYC